MRKVCAAALGAALLASAGAVSAQVPAGDLRPDQVEYRGLLKEMVETNTALSNGSCTLLAEKVAGRLKAAGFADSDVTLFADPEHPKEGGVVAVLHGSDAKAKGLLLLGHIDVVEARREDWTRDPFAFIDEGGYYYGRGVADMKAMDAVWVDTMIRLKQAKTPPKKTLKMALTCGEETAEAFNGANWLVQNKPALIDADFVLNEGGGGRLGPDGKKEALAIGVGEKTAQSYLLTVTNPGGHSSRPRPDNAIYELADALQKVRTYFFPAKLNDTTRISFAMRAERGDAVAAALKTLMADPANAEAARIAATDVNVNSVLHTNCVATRLEAGHANNALPQRATAVVNCRIFPGETVEETRDALVKAIGNKGVDVAIIPPIRPIATPVPLDPKVVDPMKKVAEKHFPGVPMLPSMLAGATDGRYFGPTGMKVYGAPGQFGDPDGNGVHGLNERMRITSVMEGRDYLFDLVKTYIGAK